MKHSDSPYVIDDPGISFNHLDLAVFPANVDFFAFDLPHSGHLDWYVTPFLLVIELIILKGIEEDSISRFGE